MVAGMACFMFPGFPRVREWRVLCSLVSRVCGNDGWWRGNGVVYVRWVPAYAGMTDGGGNDGWWRGDGVVYVRWVPACAGMTGGGGNDGWWCGNDVLCVPWVPAYAGMTTGWGLYLAFWGFMLGIVARAGFCQGYRT